VAVKAVFFDLGETLVDETRLWTTVAEAVGVPAFTFFAVAGALIERGVRDPRRIFDELEVEPASVGGFEKGDFYPDALPCLETLRAAGYVVGVVGNTGTQAEELVRPYADVVGSSEGWGVSKPEPAFFSRLCEEADAAPEEIAYVGDRVDNDVEPALRAGMVAVHIRRGPWGWLQQPPADAIRIKGLAEVPEAIGG
jgi:HAD superfamily hydrolase (TIGR01549 family)